MYFVWGLIPFWLFLFSVKAVFRRVMKRPGKEYPIFYFQQGLFASVALAVAIVIDQYWLEPIFHFVGLGWVNIPIVAYALYPLILLGFSMLQKPFEESDRPHVSDELRGKMRLAKR